MTLSFPPRSAYIVAEVLPNAAVLSPLPLPTLKSVMRVQNGLAVDIEINRPKKKKNYVRCSIASSLKRSAPFSRPTCVPSPVTVSLALSSCLALFAEHARNTNRVATPSTYMCTQDGYLDQSAGVSYSHKTRLNFLLSSSCYHSVLPRGTTTGLAARGR